MKPWKQLSVLVTGGTGSFGQTFVKNALKKHSPRRLIVLSRDELKQFEMRQKFPDTADSPMRYFLGDVRDKDRLYRAFKGVDVVVHAAALKHVPIAEYNPLEVIKTNILGAANVIDAAIDCGVRKVVALSSDKAVLPVNLYGATKLCSDKLFNAASVYSGTSGTLFSVVRYGNVICSRGSVIPFFKKLSESGTVPITDPRMTRFWITLEQAVAFVFNCLGMMKGGEIFIPKLPSMRVLDIAKAVAPRCIYPSIGNRPGEKLHEILINEDEARECREYDTYYVVHPKGRKYPRKPGDPETAGKKIPEGFIYGSDNNSWWLEPEELLHLAEEYA